MLSCDTLRFKKRRGQSLTVGTVELLDGYRLMEKGGQMGKSVWCLIV